MQFNGFSYFSLAQFFSQTSVAGKFQFVASNIINISRSPAPLSTLPKMPTSSAHCSNCFSTGAAAPCPVFLVKINWMKTERELNMEIAVSEIAVSELA